MAQRVPTLLAVIVLAAVGLRSPAKAQIQRTRALSATGASDELKHAVEDKGYRVTLDDGWTAEFWFGKQLKTAQKEVPGALYPELANAEFVGVVNLPKGMTDFRGQAIPAGAYTLRYQLLPQDANHMGVSPNPDFLLAIPVAVDPDPAVELPFKKLVSLSAKTTGTAHPAVIALATAGTPGAVAQDEQGMTFLTVELSMSVSGKTEKFGIVLRGQ